jgi:hypothetical protein
MPGFVLGPREGPAPQVRPAGGGINPAQVSLAVKLRQRIEERARRWVSRERRGDITALRVRGSTHRWPAGTSLVRIRQLPIVPLTG